MIWEFWNDNRVFTLVLVTGFLHPLDWALSEREGRVISLPGESAIAG